MMNNINICVREMLVNIPDLVGNAGRFVLSGSFSTQYNARERFRYADLLPRVSHRIARDTNAR